MPARLATVLAALALVVALFALVLAVRPPAATEAEELANYMAFVQRHAEKLYLAGTNGNAALAQFYVEELEETFEEIEHGGYVEDGQDVSALVETMALPALESVEQAVTAEALASDTAGARFEARYAALVNACNSCHETTGHGYVRIVVPEGSRFPGQDFRPVTASLED